MKWYYDSSVRPKTYTEGEKLLVYDPRKKGGKFAKWQVCWKGLVTVEHKLNDTNYVLQKTAKSKPVVVHVDRMRKLLNQWISNLAISIHALNQQMHHVSDIVLLQQTHTVWTARAVHTNQQQIQTACVKWLGVLSHARRLHKLTLTLVWTQTVSHLSSRICRARVQMLQLLQSLSHMLRVYLLSHAHCRLIANSDNIISQVA